MKQDLHPCPYCGSSRCEVEGGSARYVHCWDCHCYGPSSDLGDELDERDRQAAVRWNRRTVPQSAGHTLSVLPVAEAACEL